MKRINIMKLLVAGLISVLSLQKTSAQLNPLGSQYFQNQYLGNPAMAGISEGIQVNLAFRQQWGSIPGAPSTQAITADYRLNNKVGLGINLYNDEAGLLKRTRTTGTYAYHLPLINEDQYLHFGLSLGFMYERVMNENIRGDQDDLSIGRFNQRETFIDGDFGAAYTNRRITIQGTIPNMKNFLQKDKYNSADRSVFFTSISYKWYTKREPYGIVVEPKVAYRGVKGYNNLLDLGINLSTINNRLNLTGIYHSSRSATFGVGFTYETISFIGVYTTETSALRGYAGGNFEIGLKGNLFKKVR